MNTKPALRLDEDLIESAKRHAGRNGKSVSQMVADYFYVLDKKTLKESQQITPLVNSLKGYVKNSDLDEKDYKAYLKEKYYGNNDSLSFNQNIGTRQSTKKNQRSYNNILDCCC